jgi:predicted secreted protein
MASTGVNNGTLIGIYIGGVKIAKSTNGSIEFKRATRNVTSKDSAGWMQKEFGLGEWSISGDFLDAEDSAYRFSDLYALLLNKTKVTVKFSSNVTGDKYYQGTALITSLSKQAPMEENVAGAYTLEGDGAPSELTA